MARGIKIIETAITGTPTAQSPKVIELPNKTVSVAITNMVNSGNDLWIGWDEDPSTKDFLQQGQSRPYGPYRTDDYITNRTIKFAFNPANTGVINQALVVISYEADDDVCFTD